MLFMSKREKNIGCDKKNVVILCGYKWISENRQKWASYQAEQPLTNHQT